MSLAGENALPLFTPGQVNVHALYRIVENTDAWLSPLQVGILSPPPLNISVLQLSRLVPMPSSVTPFVWLFLLICQLPCKVWACFALVALLV